MRSKRVGIKLIVMTLFLMLILVTAQDIAKRRLNLR